MITNNSHAKSKTGIQCKICTRFQLNQLAGVCARCIQDIFEDNSASGLKVAGILGVATSALKKLETEGKLVPNRTEYGSRIYNLESLEKYIESLSEVSQYKLLKGEQEYIKSTTIQKKSLVKSSICERCGVNVSYENNYCIECLDNFVSRPQASAIIGCTLAKLDSLISEYPDLLKLYPYSTQVRLNYIELLSFIDNHPNSQKLNEKWSPTALKCRFCKSTEKPHFGGGLCEDCYRDSKEYTVMNGYMHGQNLSELGDAVGVTRERARQLFEKAVKIESEVIVEGRPQLSIYEIREQLKKEHKQNRAERDYKEEIEENYDQIIQKLGNDNVIGEKGLLDTLGMPVSVLKYIRAQYPEFLEIVNNNVRSWSWKFDKCVNCGTTEVKHKLWGYCLNCYTKSPQWRKSQASYRERHSEEIKQKVRAYGVDYSRRPEVKEKMKLRSQEKLFSGNRELAITSNGNCCVNCKIPRATYLEINGKDLSVYHIDKNKANNDLSNLIPLCLSCLSKRTKALW